MSKKKTLTGQAEAILKKDLALGKSKASVSLIGKTTYKQFTSLRSFNETASTLGRIGQSLGVDRLKHITPAMAQEYLNSRHDQVRAHSKILHAESSSKFLSQKTLDSERKALSVLLRTPIARIYTSHKNNTQSRAYTKDQIMKITQFQTEKNALSTQIAHSAGLRVSELFTLHRCDEIEISSKREWDKERFVGEDGVKYAVKGKGGLIREVILSHELSKKLEQRRLQTPVEITDRKIRYQANYDIVGGNALSKSIGEASQRALGFSHGAHGLRHNYAQSRYQKLRQMGYSDERARKLVSQEVGHFRASITNVYLR